MSRQVLENWLTKYQPFFFKTQKIYIVLATTLESRGEEDGKMPLLGMVEILLI